MLKQRLWEFVEPRLRDDERIVVAMAGFRPLTRSAALMAIFAFVLAGFAASTASGMPAWVGGGLGGALGAGTAAWLDHRRARFEHDGKGLGVGLVVTDRRLFILELATGVFTASVSAIDVEQDLADIVEVETQKMQGSGLKRVGAVVRFADGTTERVIPARTDGFLECVRAG